ncbi:hypothetical protein GCG21_09885 [Pseudactinotalea sp. HY160]|uniref:hypothetical protein n=1 Tax=Pseudactinotalea sp. HY160 TaxID=2654490 RepID=UPI00128E61CB|nr:hypothetical protein [Pseudactinotalea sp. HY160]MPV50307.1 hypothetical protein [Pseudactinotalea sp. HY160]
MEMPGRVVVAVLVPVVLTGNYVADLAAGERLRQGVLRTVLRRIIAIALIVVGLAGIAGAIGSATVWKPATVVTLDLPATPDVPYVITRPGALTAVNDSVGVTVVAADSTEPVVLALGRAGDVTAWVGDSPHWVITGLQDWDHLSYSVGAPAGEPTDDATAGPTEEPTGDPDAADESAPADPANPAGSDLWIDQVEGVGEIQYTWSKVPGSWSMLVAGDGSGPAPQVELTWERDVPTPLLVPGIIGGALLLLIGLALLSADLLARREARRAPAADSYEPELTAQLQAIDPDRPLTRRELREAERARGRRGAAGAPSQQRSDATEVIPAVGGRSAEESAAAELAAWAGGAAAGSGAPARAAGDPAARVDPADLAVPAFLVPTTAPATATTEPAEPAGTAGTTAPQWPALERTETIPAVSPVEPLESRESSEPVEPAAPAQTRRRWWRRRRTDGEPGPGEGPTRTEAASSLPPAEPDEPEPNDSEPNPRASGASWRATWGMGAAERPGHEPGEPDDGEPDDAGDSEEKR